MTSLAPAFCYLDESAEPGLVQTKQLYVPALELQGRERMRWAKLVQTQSPRHTCCYLIAL